MKYYNRLKDLREDHDLKQEFIASFLNTTRQQYSRWESGAYQTPIEIYKKLSKFYNISIDYLSGLIDTPKTIDGKPYKIEFTNKVSGNNNTIVNINGNGNKTNIK